LRISQHSIEEVREAASIVEVASEFTALKRQGTRFVGLCPYPDHSEKTPSFSVAPDRGFYYCFGCLNANELIWTSRGLIPIAAAELGEEVLGLGGRREIIVDKWFKSGPTLRIASGAAKEGIELTPDHTCLYISREEALRALSGVHLRGPREKTLRFSQRLRRKDSDVRITVGPASDIREGDFWLYPVIPEIERSDAPLPGERVIKPYTKVPRTPRIHSLPVNPSTAWLYGVWLAKGSIYRGNIKWSFGAHEVDTLTRRVIRTLDEDFGRSATVFSRSGKNLCEVACSSTDLSVLFAHWFGSGCERKRIPFEALSWSRECQHALLEGYLDGDGRFADGFASAASVSVELAYGIFALCVQARRVCSLSSRAARTGNDGVRRTRCYYVHVLNKESLKGFFANIGGEDYYLSMVQRVGEVNQAPSTVVDITTTGSHSFLTKMGITHNCQRGGDAIKLVSELKSFSFVDAVSYLAERSGVELEFEGGEGTEAARERTLRRRKVHKALAAAAVYYHKYLIQSSSAEATTARNYLRDRGLEVSTIEEFRLGYAPPRSIGGFVRVAGKLDLDRETLDAAGLLSIRGGERFSGRITFPISDRRGRIVGFGARALGEDHPKYLNSPETQIFNKRDLLYGFPQVLEAIRKERAALVVEGYTDVLMLYQSGIRNAVATLGTATTSSHLRTLSGYADRIYLLFDPDEAGERATQKARAAAREAIDPEDSARRGGVRNTRGATVAAARMKLDLRVLRLSEDPADWLREHRSEEFAELLSGAVPILEYVFRHRLRRLRDADTAERSRGMSEIRGFLREIRAEDPVFYQDALYLAAETLSVNPQVLEEGRAATPRANPSQKPAQTDPLERAGRELLTLAFTYPGLVTEFLREGLKVRSLPEPIVLRAEDFADASQAGVFSLLQEHAGKGVDAVLADERAQPYLDLISALVSEGARDVIATDKSRRGEKIVPSRADAAQAWIGLKLLSCERSKRNTENLDERERIRAQVQALKKALELVSIEP